MFAAPRDLGARKRSGSRSTDDHSFTRDRPRKSLPSSPAPQPYAREHSVSSHSLRTTHSHHDDPPISTPGRIPPPHTPSTHSSPVTSPSSGYGRSFPSSHSSYTSESPMTDSRHRSEFGVLTTGSPYANPSHAQSSRSSHSLHPVHPRSRSTTESDIHSPVQRAPRKFPSSHSSIRPSTAPHSPSTPVSGGGSSAAESQSQGHGTTTRLSMGIKNLLSKPALPSPSRFSFQSTPSDSEASSRSRGVTRTNTPRKSRPLDLDVAECPSSLPSSTSNPMDAHRRYASDAAKVYSSPMSSATPTSQESLDLSSHKVPPPPRGRDQKPRNVLRRRPSGSAKLVKEKHRDKGMVDKNDPPLPLDSPQSALVTAAKDRKSRVGSTSVPLTPAGAVVEAYKQQELRREDGSAHKQSIDAQELTASPKTSQDEDTPARSPTPYYTVFGTSSGRRIAAGGPDDRWSRLESHVLPDQRAWIGAGTPAPNQADSGSRSLTRKVSSRWKKVTGGGVAPEESPSRSAAGHSKGRPSLQEGWSSGRSGRSKERGRSAGRSMDGMADLRDEVWAGPLASHGRSKTDQGSENAEMSGKDAGEGGKIWKLMKRISTGGLRERFQADKAAPPVPAIPKELLGRMSQVPHTDHSPEAAMRNPSAARQSSRHRQSASSHEKDRSTSLSRPPTAPKNIPGQGPRPSMATTSSSPNSSDVASSRFFQKTHSARSSVSSYGEVRVPPVPEITIDQHIMAPLEQLRLCGDHPDTQPGASRSRSPRRVASVPADLRTLEHIDEPLPPSLSKGSSGETSAISSHTPTSANSFAKQKHDSQNGAAWSPLADGGVSLSPPPPRPPRNSTRGVGSSGPNSPHNSSKPEVVVEAPKLHRASPSVHSEASTAKLRPRSNSFTSITKSTLDQSQPRSQLTFREMDGPRRPPLSEREKADIWDDLLARSEKAGGTLHLGGGELMSDNIRFSNYSEMS